MILRWQSIDDTAREIVLRSGQAERLLARLTYVPPIPAEVIGWQKPEAPAESDDLELEEDDNVET